MAAAVDPAFSVVPKGSTCFHIWRIENFQPKAVPKDQFGSFYEGDSYILLVMVPPKETASPDMKVRAVRGALDQRIHYWIGEKSTRDEAGTAAIKAVELDDFLGGTPIQYREVQGSESKTFLSYFKKAGGVNYMTGGVASGFSHVDNKVKPRLMHVKGKSTPRIKEVAIGWENMNSGDAFILDIGEALFVWNGQSCSRTEKIKAMQFARKLRDQRGKGNLIVVEEGEENAGEMGEDEFALFDHHLPSADKGNVKDASAGGPDDAYERKAAANLKLWKVAEEGSQLKITEVAAKPLQRNQLDTGDSFIVDNGEAGIWVWCGKLSSPKEKKEAMSNATAFLGQRNYPDHVQVIKVHESGEPAEFKTLFKVWDKPLLPGQVRPMGNKVARTVQTKFDAATMHSNPEVAAETGMVDDGSGTRKIYRVERKDNMYDLVELEKKHHGHLFGGDSYVILYTYLLNGREMYILYFWLGKKSTQDERGVAARKTVELDDTLGGAAKQVRVVHGKEPNHFLAMFGGKLIIFEGGKAGWGQNKDEGVGDQYLLHIRGTNSYNTKAEQVPCRAESLNSNDVFVLVSKTSSFIWAGKGCTGDEREMAKSIASISPKGYTLISEGQEKEDFWSLLGGKAEYQNDPRLAEPESEHPPRLFQCSNASGAFQVNEIAEFAQEDLVTDDVFILDVFDKVFVWVGVDARPEEKTMSMDAAIEYIETDPSGRDEGTPIFMVKQGMEPPDFIGYFGVWDREKWSGGLSYEQMKKEFGGQNISLEEVKNKSGGDMSFSSVSKFPYSKLKDKENLPEGVDKAHKEKHLTEEEFQEVFKMPYDKYVALPDWRQSRAKQDAQLF